MAGNAGLKKYLFGISLLAWGIFVAVWMHMTPAAVFTSAEIMELTDIQNIKKERSEYTEDAVMGELYYGDIKLPYSDYNRTMYLALGEA